MAHAGWRENGPLLGGTSAQQNVHGQHAEDCTDHAERLAASFEHANAELIRFVEQVSDQLWRGWCEREGRTIGVVVYDIAAGSCSAAT
jgi:hypothetical protein